MQATYLDKKQEFRNDVPFYKDIKTGPTYVKPREPISFRDKISYRNTGEWDRLKPTDQQTVKSAREDEIIKDSIRRARQDRLAKEKELISRRENYTTKDSKAPPMTSRVDPKGKDDYGVPKEPATDLDKGDSEGPDGTYKFKEDNFNGESVNGLPSDMMGSRSPRKAQLLGKSGGKLDVADEIAIMMQRKGAGVKVR